MAKANTKQSLANKLEFTVREELVYAFRAACALKDHIYSKKIFPKLAVKAYYQALNDSINILRYYANHSKFTYKPTEDNLQTLSEVSNNQLLKDSVDKINEEFFELIGVAHNLTKNTEGLCIFENMRLDIRSHICSFIQLEDIATVSLTAQNVSEGE